jgi:hypothetical protein
MDSPPLREQEPNRIFDNDVRNRRREANLARRAERQVPAVVPIGPLPRMSPPVMTRPMIHRNLPSEPHTRHGGKKTKTNKRRQRKSSKRSKKSKSLKSRVLI